MRFHKRPCDHIIIVRSGDSPGCSTLGVYSFIGFDDISQPCQILVVAIKYVGCQGYNDDKIKRFVKPFDTMTLKCGMYSACVIVTIWLKYIF